MYPSSQILSFISPADQRPTPRRRGSGAGCDSASPHRWIEIELDLWTLCAGVMCIDEPSDHHLVGAVSYHTVFWVVARPCGTMRHRHTACGGDAHRLTGRIQIMF